MSILIKFLFFITMIVFIGCNGAFYQGSKNELFIINRDRVTYEDRYYQSGDNVLHGRFFPAENRDSVKGVVVQFHGNAENLSTHFIGLIWVVYRDYDLFVWDYSGYGESQGESSREQLYKDGLATLDYVLDSIQSSSKRFIVFGQSLGGAVAPPVLASWEHRDTVNALIIDSSFPHYRSAARSVLSQRWWTWWLQPLVYLTVTEAYAPIDYYEQLSDIPTVIAHCKQDQVINYDLGLELYKQIRGPKVFFGYDKCGHIGAFTRFRLGHNAELFNALDSLESVVQQASE